MSIIHLRLFLLCSWAICIEAAAATSTKDPVSSIRHLLPLADLTNVTTTNITVQTGTTSFLPCKFRHLADHQVSWFRRRDWHILTTGIVTYTNDQRFMILHPPDSEDWTLQVKYTQPRDSGIYECQLSTGTGATSQFVNLQVVEPRARIAEGSEYHVQLGSTIKLVCIIDETPKPPDFVFWYRDRQMMNYDTSRGGINVNTTLGKETKSYLTISNASAEDSGNYSCTASNTSPAHTNVFVSLGDKMAAIQRRKSSIAHRSSMSRRVAFLSLLVTLPHSISFFIDLLLRIGFLFLNLLCKNLVPAHQLFSITR